MIDLKKTPVLYLDIDGTVRHGYDELGRFVNGPEDVVVFPEAVERMREWKDAGGRIIGVTNQGGIALGLVSVENVWNAIMETQAQTGGLFDDIKFCVHHPDADEPEKSQCWCRKPRPGLVIEGATQLLFNSTQLDLYETYPAHLALMVGDREEDRLCAEAANINFMDAGDWRNGKAYEL